MAEPKERWAKPQVTATQKTTSRPLAKASPKIETIHDIDDAKSRTILIKAINSYLEASAYRKESGMEEKNWLDNVTDAFGIRRISELCEGITYKTSAQDGIAILTDAGKTDPDMTSHLKRLADSSPYIGERLRGRVLDFGCNVGWLTQLLRHKYGATSIGVDVDRNAIGLGRFFGVKGLLPIEREDGTLPFKNGYFDMTILKSVLNCHTISNLTVENIIREVARVTKPGGIILISGELGPDKMNHRRSGLKRFRTDSTFWDAWVRMNGSAQDRQNE